MKRGSLRSKIVALENRANPRALPTVYLALYGKSDLDIRGYKSSNCEVSRLPGERVSELRERATQITQARLLITLY